MDTARSNVSDDSYRSNKGSKKLFHALWTTSEDHRLQQLVNIRGPKEWLWIASHMEGRSAKQCNKRWHYKLLVNPIILDFFRKSYNYINMVEY